MTLYSNYLAEVGKLVFIIGQIQTTSSFKKLLDSNNDQKSKFFFKCVDELPVNTYKKSHSECRRKGMVECDWFNKIMDKTPMMIFMIFNYTQPLQPNQKWQDRLNITLRKINKVYDILRSSSKQQVILRIVIIISKQAVLQSQQTGSIIERINAYLKIYEKQLHIYQADLLTKQINKNKAYWFSSLQKAYQKKYRQINKRKEESTGQVRLGCLVKMAVIAQIISKKDSYSQYDEAYRSLHFRFVELTKNKAQFSRLDQIRQTRTMADIVLLRRLIVKIALSTNFQNVPETITNHMRYFSHNNQNQHVFFSYETMMWRQNFLHNLLEVLYTNDHIQVIPKSYFAQLINTAISLSYKLCKTNQYQNLLTNQFKGRIIPIQSPVYIGSRNYTIGLQINDSDILWTEINQLLQRKKDFITRGLQTITRYKSMKVFRKHQINFFNIYLLRFYLADEKFGSIGNIFNQIMRLKIQQYDFYSLNYLIDQLQKQTERSTQHRILIHSLAVLIADYFKNRQQLEKYGLMLINILPQKTKKLVSKKSQNIDLLGDMSDLSETQNQEQNHDQGNVIQKDPLILPLPNQSLTFSLSIVFLEKLHMIENQFQFSIIPKFNNNFLRQCNKKATLKLFFNKAQIKIEKQINFPNLGSDGNNQIKIKIDPLKYFTKDQTLQIKSAALVMCTNPQIHFIVQNLFYPKHKSIILITKLKVPQILINLPYETYYLNQISKFAISMQAIEKSTKIDITFSVISDSETNNTEVFMNPNQKLNLINSNYFQPISPYQNNIVYLKCNKIGPKVLKFVFNITITQHIGQKQLKDFHVVSKQVGFKVNNLFKTLKILKQAYTGMEVKQSQIPTNKNIIMNYNIRASQSVNIIQLGQYKSPKPYFHTHKNINTITNYKISNEEKLNNVYIFEVLQDQLKLDDKIEKEKELFLISFYIKWCRVDMNKKLAQIISLNSHKNFKGVGQFTENFSNNENEIVNLYNEDQLKITVKSDKVEIEYQQGKTLKKRQKQQLKIKYRNLTNQKIHVYSMMENTQQILRIGSKSSQILLQPKETKSISFQVLPVKSGYFKFPTVRTFFDGIQAKQKIYASIVCVI